MSDKEYRPSKVEMLAALVIGRAQQSHAMATIQRSHRFPLDLFAQIENLANHADVPVSVIINELLECGLDALKRELPEDVAQEISHLTRKQIDRPSTTDRFDSKEYRARAKRKKR